MMRHFRKGDALTSRVFREQLNKLVDTRNAVEQMSGDGLVVVNHTRTGMVVGLALDAVKRRLFGEGIPQIDGDIVLDIQAQNTNESSIAEFVTGDWRGREMFFSVAHRVGTPALADTNSWSEATNPPQNTYSAMVPVAPTTDITALSFEGVGGCQFNLKVDKDDGHLYVVVTDYTARTQVRVCIKGWPVWRSTSSTSMVIKAP